MSVYLISVDRLGPKPPDSVSVSAPGTPSKISGASAKAVPAGKKSGKPRRTSRKTAARAPRDGGPAAQWPTSAEDVLRLPPNEIRELLASCSDPMGKIVLVLLYRLALVESELKELSTQLRSASLSLTLAGGGQAHIDRGSSGAGSKDAVLDELFQKNVALRRKSGAG